MPVWGIVKTAALRCRGQFDALLPEAEMPRAMVHRVVQAPRGSSFVYSANCCPLFFHYVYINSMDRLMTSYERRYMYVAAARAY